MIKGLLIAAIVGGVSLYYVADYEARIAQMKHDLAANEAILHEAAVETDKSLKHSQALQKALDDAIRIRANSKAPHCALSSDDVKRLRGLGQRWLGK